MADEEFSFVAGKGNQVLTSVLIGGETIRFDEPIYLEAGYEYTVRISKIRGERQISVGKGQRKAIEHVSREARAALWAKFPDIYRPGGGYGADAGADGKG